MKQFSATFIQTLKDAIVGSFWYREELRRYLAPSLTDASLLDGYDWKTQNKRTIVNHLIDSLAADQSANFEDFRRLARGILELSRYPGLERLEDARARIQEARRLQAELGRLVDLHNDNVRTQKQEAEYKFLKEEYERRKKQDETRARRREEDDALRESDPDRYFGRVLKLTGRVTKDQIKTRYRELMKIYHPDRFQHLDEEFTELATWRSQQINEAFKYLARRHGIS